MAKLKAPLLSLGASGAIGKSLVFFGWKGLDVVREYVIPSNPQTTKQTTQRDYVKNCVAAIHATILAVAIKLTLDDKTAYALKGSTFPTPSTWFNQIVKNWIDVKVKVKKPCILCSGGMDNPAAADFRPHIYFAAASEDTPDAGTFYLGSTKTAIIASKAAVIAAAEGASLNVAGGFSGLTVGRKYYWWFNANTADPCEGVESGIYGQVTA